MGKRTSLYQRHLAAGARMTDFAGWDMPLHYGSSLEEHRQVREATGVFDVSHMTVVDVRGSQAAPFLGKVLANDIGKLAEPGRALYTVMLTPEGGVVDDLIAYRMADGYRLVVNCATTDKDLDWLAQHSESVEVAIQARPDLAILAVHGPGAIAAVCDLLPPQQAETVAALGGFRATEVDGWFIARTGYTGEKGLELILPADQAPDFWDRLLAAGIQPVGLGARDSLRLEAGMNLYGQDMDETTSPVEANLMPFIALEPRQRAFIGRRAVEAHIEEQEQGRRPYLMGLVLEGRGVLRRGQKVVTHGGDGIITSGGFSPTLQHSIALARIPVRAGDCQVEVRRERLPVRIVKPGFVRFGKKIFA